MTEAVTNPGPLLGDRLELLGAQRDQPVQGCGNVVDVPAHDRPARACGKLGRGELPVDDAQFVLVVADAELDVAWPAPGGLAGVIRFDAQQLGVPAGRRRQVLGPQVYGAHSAQHDKSFPRPWGRAEKICSL